MFMIVKRGWKKIQGSQIHMIRDVNQGILHGSNGQASSSKYFIHRIDRVIGCLKGHILVDDLVEEAQG